MLGMLIIAVMGLYIARQRKQITQLRGMLDSCLDDLEGPWFRQPQLAQTNAKPKPKKFKRITKKDLDGLPID